MDDLNRILDDLRIRLVELFAEADEAVRAEEAAAGRLFAEVCSLTARTDQLGARVRDLAGLPKANM